MQSLFMFGTMDVIIDNCSLLHLDLDVPAFPIKLAATVTATTFSLIWSYPFAVTVRRLVEHTPKEISEGVFKKNYRRAFTYIYYINFNPNVWKGMSSYFHSNFIWVFTSLYVAESLGLFKNWKTNYTSFPATNSIKTFYV